MTEFARRVEYRAPGQVVVTVAVPRAGHERELACDVCGACDGKTAVLFACMDGAYEPCPGVCERCTSALARDARARLGM